MARDRSAGWTHAKLSGHQNEKEVCRKIATFTSIKALNPAHTIKDAEFGGIAEGRVPGILGKATKSKTDITLTWDDDSTTNISLKKSLAGQVYLIKASRFIQGFEMHYEKIDDLVKMGLLLFFGEHPDVGRILSKHRSPDRQIQAYQERKERLVWSTMMSFDRATAMALLGWFRAKIGTIADFCFSKGLAADSRDWARYVWYKNLMGEHDVDRLFAIDGLTALCGQNSHLVEVGDRGGGTTIALPFGFVQWHQGQMQFHHRFEDIENLFN